MTADQVKRERASLDAEDARSPGAPAAAPAAQAAPVVAPAPNADRLAALQAELAALQGK
jgi:hypothetical protein